MLHVLTVTTFVFLFQPHLANHGIHDAPTPTKFGVVARTHRRDITNLAAASSQDGKYLYPSSSTPNPQQPGVEDSTFFSGVRITDVCLALFTLLLTICTWLLWRATADLVKRSERASKTDLRAYIGAPIIALNRTDPKRPQAQAVIRNFGKTPSYRVANRIGLELVDYPSDPIEFGAQDPDLMERSKPMIWPGQDYVCGQAMDGVLTDSDLEELTNGTKIIYIYGHISYEDIFGDKHETWYNYMWGGPIGTKDVHCAVSPQGNRAT